MSYGIPPVYIFWFFIWTIFIYNFDLKNSEILQEFFSFRALLNSDVNIGSHLSYSLIYSTSALCHLFHFHQLFSKWYLFIFPDIFISHMFATYLFFLLPTTVIIFCLTHFFLLFPKFCLNYKQAVSILPLIISCFFSLHVFFNHIFFLHFQLIYFFIVELVNPICILIVNFTC